MAVAAISTEQKPTWTWTRARWMDFIDSLCSNSEQKSAFTDKDVHLSSTSSDALLEFLINNICANCDQKIWLLCWLLALPKHNDEIEGNSSVQLIAKSHHHFDELQYLAKSLVHIETWNIVSDEHKKRMWSAFI